MNKKKIEVITTAALVLIFLIFALRAVFSPKRAREEEIYREEIKTPVSIEKVEEFPTLEEKIKSETKDLKWARDPFFMNKYIEKVSVDKIGEIEALSLAGIIWDDENPTALISDEIVKEGDFIGEFEVKKIKRDRVILIKDNKENELNLK
jgi:hypothetical protein